MQKVLGTVSFGSRITRSPANSGKDTSLPLQALCASLAPGVVGFRAGSTIYFAEIAEKE
jgi:hypothetical protein